MSGHSTLWLGDFTGPIATLSHEIKFDRQTEVKLRFHGSDRNPFARNEVRLPKTGVKLRFNGSDRNPFARNEVRSPKTAVKV